MPIDRARSGAPWWASPKWLVALVLAAGAALWWPAAHDVRELRTRIQAAKAQLHDASQITREMAQLTGAIAAMDQELHSAGKTIPEQDQLADLLRELGTRIERHGLEDSTIASRPVEPGPHFSTMPVEIDFRGRSLDAFDFIAGIERMERLVQVTRLRLVGQPFAGRDGAPAGPTRIEATVRLDTYFHDPAGGER